MLKKLLQLLVKHVIWPLIELVLIAALQQLAQWVIERIREFFRKWRKEESEEAATDEDRAAIQKKYDRRDADLAAFEQEIAGKVQEIVRVSLAEANRQTDSLIDSAAKKPALQDVSKKLESK
jgi:hypothetical protein